LPTLDVPFRLLGAYSVYQWIFSLLHYVYLQVAAFLAALFSFLSQSTYNFFVWRSLIFKQNTVTKSKKSHENPRPFGASQVWLSISFLEEKQGPSHIRDFRHENTKCGNPFFKCG
jgi:hypothetical protein